MQTVEQPDQITTQQAECAERLQVLKARWKPLTDRLYDEIARGYTLNRVVIEAELTRSGNGFFYCLSTDHLTAWCKSHTALMGGSRYVGQPSVKEELEAKLIAWFALLDTERAAAKNTTLPLIKTAVARQVWDCFEQARELCVVSELDAPPGTGKTCAADLYLSQCRKLEGFNCPVWRIALSEFSTSLKSVLQLIAHEINPDYSDTRTASDSDVVRWIAEQTEGRGGLLIVDEAQHIGDSNKLHGINILNGLRYFVDHRLFGVALLGNGEVYRRVAGGKHKQLSSRMEAWRVTIKGVPEEDVDAIMAAYRVSGKPTRAWCVKKASGAGGLRALVNAFSHAQRKFDEVNYQTLTLLERL